MLIELVTLRLAVDSSLNGSQDGFVALTIPHQFAQIESILLAKTEMERGGSANPDIELSEISASMGDGNRLPRSRSNEKTPP